MTKTILSLNALLAAILMLGVNQGVAQVIQSDHSISRQHAVVDPQSTCPDGITPRPLLLDGVELTVCTNFLSGQSFILPAPDGFQVASASSLSYPIQEISIAAVPYGLKDSFDGLPPAQPQGAEIYRSILQMYKQGGTPFRTVTANIFGKSVLGWMTTIYLDVGIEGGSAPFVIAEWVVEEGGRIWIIRASQELDTIQTETDSFERSISGISLISVNVNSPSSSLLNNAAEIVFNPAIRPQTLMPQVQSPPWWNGDCDTNYYYANTSPHQSAFPLGSSYLGVESCGPRPIAGGQLVVVQFFSKAQGELEWECVELVMRFMYQVYGVNPYSVGVAKNVVANWNASYGGNFSKIANGTANSAPQAGDIIAYSYGTAGHSAVVSASQVDIDGNGSITVIEQNNSSQGVSTNNVQNWNVQSNLIATGWLHPVGSGCPYSVGQGTSGSELAAFQNAYNSGGGYSSLACPTSTVSGGFTSFAGTVGHYQLFANGDIEYLTNGTYAGNAYAVLNPLYNKWASLGFTASNPLGYPIAYISSQSTSYYGTSLKYQSFENGALEWHLSGARSGNVYEVHGAIYAKWGQKGYSASPLGLPISNERDAQASGATGKTGRVSDFEGGHIHWITGASYAYESHGAIDSLFASMGGSGSWLGFPTSDEYVASSSYARSDFEGGFITTTDGVNYQAFHSTIQATVQTNPAGRSFTVDGSTYTADQTFPWTSGSSHTISTTTPQSGASGTQYVWSSWSDSGDISHTVSPTSSATYTANFTTQYLLTMNAGTGGTVSPASGYYNSGQSVQIQATAISGSFTGWTGTGTGSYTGTSNPANVSMNAPITETASFAQTVQVTVQTSPSGRSFTVDGSTYTAAQTFPWTSGSSHTISTTTPQSGASGTQYVWSNWSDSGSISHTVSPTSSATYTANFTTQYLLTMNAGTGGTVSPASGYYNSGQSVQIQATAISGSFTGWTGTGTGSYTGTSNPANVSMNAPITETASFAQTVQVTVQTSPSGRSFTVRRLDIHGGSDVPMDFGIKPYDFHDDAAERRKRHAVRMEQLERQWWHIAYGVADKQRNLHRELHNAVPSDHECRNRWNCQPGERLLQQRPERPDTGLRKQWVHFFIVDRQRYWFL